MKPLIAILVAFLSQVSLSAVLEFELSNTTFSDSDKVLLEQTFDAEFVEIVESMLVKGKTISIRVDYTNAQYGDKSESSGGGSDRDCEVTIKRSGSGSVGGNGAIIGGNLNGAGSSEIVIKGPCKEVKEILKAIQDTSPV